MEINKEIPIILKEFHIDKDAGLLVLLGIYYKLDVDTVCPEEVIKAINTTKIVEKDYVAKTIKWNVPLFIGQETAWAWVKDWNDRFGKINPTRKDNLSDVTKRMQEWFTKNPQYRVGDIMVATNKYFGQLKEAQYLKSSAKFIYEGIGASKTSMLLTWCERVTNSGGATPFDMKGNIVT